MVGNLAGRGEGERGAGWIRLHDGGRGHPVPYREELRARPGQSQAFLFSHMSSLLFSDIRVVKLMNINYYHNVPQTFQHRLVPDWIPKAMGLQQGLAQASKISSTRRELFQMVFFFN